MLPSSGQVKIIQCVYLIVFLSGYVKILQPVDICTVVFVTATLTNTDYWQTKLSISGPPSLEQSSPNLFLYGL